MSQRWPLLPTLIVIAAVATMIGLGIWQLQRAEWKEGLIGRYQGALSMSSDVAWPRDAAEVEDALYRHTSVTCDRVLALGAMAGRSAEGRQGWAYTARCALDGGGEADISLGWAEAPGQAEWKGGPVAGFVGPSGEEARLIASPPQAGLDQLAAPDPKDMPNNHMAYAVQWFFFAATALVVYVLALRRKQSGS